MREEKELAELLVLTRPNEDFDCNEVACAIEASLDEAPYTPEDPVLWSAALRASLVDRGPLGVSQAAKVVASGDASVGQQHLLVANGNGAIGNGVSPAGDSQCVSTLAYAGRTASKARQSVGGTMRPVSAPRTAYFAYSSGSRTACGTSTMSMASSMARATKMVNGTTVASSAATGTIARR